MPVITVKARKAWHVPDDDLKPEEINSPRGPWTSKQRTTWYLACELREIVATVMTRYRFMTDVHDVGVDFELLHSRAINFPDIWLTIAPMWSLERERFQELLSNDIQTEVEAFLARRLTSDNERPSFDLEVIFVHGAGCSVDKTGKQVAAWNSEAADTAA